MLMLRRLLPLLLLLAAPVSAAADGRNEELKSPRLYLIVHADDLEDSARRWERYRADRGWEVARTSLRDLNAGDDEARTRQAVRTWIHRHAETAQQRGVRGGWIAVLLLGDAPGPGEAFAPQTFVPTFYEPVHDPVLIGWTGLTTLATDNPYQLADDRDLVPDWALGRVPARSDAEASTYLDRVIAYESQEEDSAEWRSRITCVASPGRFGVVDSITEHLFLEMMVRIVPYDYRVSMLYASPSSVFCPPPSQTLQGVIDGLNEGGLIWSYTGHGNDQRLDSLHWRGKRHSLGSSRELTAGLMPSDRQRPIALLVCCSTGRYDMPEGERSLSESMLFHPGGPIGVIAGSRITHPYPNALVKKNLMHELTAARRPLLGQADLAADRSLGFPDEVDARLELLVSAGAAMDASWHSSPAELRLLHIRLYNLLGDPALEIAHPRNGIEARLADDGAIVGSVPGIERGRLTFEVEIPRDEFLAGDFLSSLGEHDPDLEEKARHNFPRANARILAAGSTDIVNGRFRIVGSEVPGNRAGLYLRLMASSEDRQDHRLGSIAIDDLAPAADAP